MTCPHCRESSRCKGFRTRGLVCLFGPMNYSRHYYVCASCHQGTSPLDGVSYLRLLTSGGQGKLDRDTLYWHFPGYLGAGPGAWRTTPAGAVRVGDWKLLEFFETGKIELYNLRNDPSEKNDLATANPGRAAELHAKLVAWRKEVKAPMPLPWTPDPTAKAKQANPA